MEFENTSFQLKLMKNVLGYPEFKVNKVIETDDSYAVEAEVIPVLEYCDKCGSDNVVNFGWASENLADTPIKGKKTTISLSRRRQRCNDCHKTFSINPPHKHGSRQLTESLVDYIGWACIDESFNKVAADVGVTKNTVRDVFTEFCEHQNELLTQNLVSGLKNFRTPTSLGIENMMTIKPSVLISNVGNQSILNLVPSKNNLELEKYLSQSLELDKVKFVVISPVESYREVVKKILPKAVIIANKKHVLNIASISLERVRTANRVGLSAKQSLQLRGDNEILVKRYSELNTTDKALLIEWSETFPIVYQAYLLKEMFYTIWEKKTKDEAVATYMEWLDCVTPNLASYFEPLVVVMTDWNKELFANIEHPQHPKYFRMIEGVVSSINSFGRSGSFLAIWAALMLRKEKSTYGICGAEYVSEQTKK